MTESVLSNANTVRYVDPCSPTFDLRVYFIFSPTSNRAIITLIYSSFRLSFVQSLEISCRCLMKSCQDLEVIEILYKRNTRGRINI